MELPFEKTVCRHWKQKQYALVSREESQEIRLPDSFPDIGRVISGWGQVVIRGKDWRSSGVGVSGGVMVWILYAPEGGGPLQRIESWIPFQARMDFADASEDGVIRVESVMKSIDTRNLSGRKLMVRVGIGLLVQTLVPHQTPIPVPGKLPDDVEQLKNTYPLMLTVETGEKTFLMDEELSLPAGMPEVDRLIYFHMEPELMEQKVMGSRGVFRGTGNLHLMYMDPEQKLCSYDFQIPFAQYVELEGEHEAEAQISTVFCITSLELDPVQDSGLRLKCGMVGQYMITAPMEVEILEDAYSPCRDVKMEREELELSAWLEDRQEQFAVSEHIANEGSTVVDQLFCPELPSVTLQTGAVGVEYGGTFQALMRDKDGQYMGKYLRTSGKAQYPTDCDTICFCQVKGTPVCRTEGSNLRLEAQVELNMKSAANRPMDAVASLKLGELRQPDPERPSVIIRSCEPGQNLWNLAKSHGSTVGAIRKMNQLTEEPEDDRLLLIPVI